MFGLQSRHQSTGGRHHPPPGKISTRCQGPANRSGGTREACAISDIAVGEHVAGHGFVQHPGHFSNEVTLGISHRNNRSRRASAGQYGYRAATAPTRRAFHRFRYLRCDPIPA